MENKHIDLLIKEAPSDVPGIVAYASTFDRIPDAYGDVVRKGAFAKSIQAIKDSGNNLPLLYGHVMDDPANIIGTVTDLKEDDHGLLIKADFDMENPMAQQVHRSVLSKAITKLSFAFSVLDEAPVELEDGTKANELRELEIYEVSLVVVPANPRAQVIAAKDGDPEMKMSEETLAVDTETEPETEAKTEEPDGAKAEEPMEQDEVEETTETKSTQESENQMENIIETIGGAAPVAEKSLKDILSETFTGKGLKDAGRFSVATPDIKAFIGTPQWLPTVSRNVEIQPDHTLADLFGQEVISGNAYTFVRILSEESADVVAEGGEKPDITPTKEVLTIPLTKVAGIIQESDELIEDADWLVSAIENNGVRELRMARDSYTFATIAADQDIQQVSFTGNIGETYLLKAITNVKAMTGYDADAIVIYPAAYVALVTASLSNPRTLFGPDYKTFLGLPLYVDTAAPANGALVGAFKSGATLVQKGGIRVEATNSDQDDFIHNLVKVRIEQRLALAVRVPAAFAMVRPAGN